MSSHGASPGTLALLAAQREFRRRSSRGFAEQSLQLLGMVDSMLPENALTSVIAALVPVSLPLRFRPLQEDELRAVRGAMRVVLAEVESQHRPSVVAGWLNEATRSMVDHLPMRHHDAGTRAVALFLNREASPVTMEEALVWGRASDPRTPADELIGYLYGGGLGAAGAMRNPAVPAEALRQLAFSPLVDERIAGYLNLNRSLPEQGAEFLFHRFPATVNWAVTNLSAMTIDHTVRAELRQRQPNFDLLSSALANPKTERSTLEAVMGHPVATDEPVLKGLAMRHPNADVRHAERLGNEALEDDRISVEPSLRLATLLASGHPEFDRTIKVALYAKVGWSALECMELDEVLLDRIDLAGVHDHAGQARASDILVFEELANVGRFSPIEWLAMENASLNVRVWAACRPDGAPMVHAAVQSAARAAAASLRGETAGVTRVVDWRELPGTDSSAGDDRSLVPRAFEL